MTPEQKQIVRSTWQQVVPIADTAAGLFYSRLFETDPALRGHFAGTDMTVQKRRLVEALDATVASLDKPETLLPALEELGRRHSGYGVEARHYETVGAALLWTLAQGLGESWSPQVKAAWSEAYGIVADTMRAGAEAAPQPA